ncbi:MAG: heterodisulfide reductase-related iron-sulfur binding cluster [Myxococcota bacterium]
MALDAPEKPSVTWSYQDEDYWDTEQLERELRRVAEVCHQCRRCLPLCPAFPKLFDLIDATDREVAGLMASGFEAVNELCYHCQLCYNHCPYTPPHDWDMNFPALMRRQQLVRNRRVRAPLAQRLTAHTDLIGKLGSWAPALMNFANRNRLSRWLMEKSLGIHRDWLQPRFFSTTVERWFRQRPAKPPGANGRVLLFTTCSVNHSDPAAGRAAVEVLEHSGVQVELAYAGCCGMPYTDVGDLARLRQSAERNVAALLPGVEAGATVVVPGPSCSLLLKREYPKLLESEAAQRVASATRDLMEYLVELARAKTLKRDFRQPLGKIAYHAPCHLRAQNIGFPARALLELAGAEVEAIEACSGVDGTWGMQARFHDESLRVAAKLLGRIEASQAARIATDCPLSALRIEQKLGRKALHPVVLLREAYGIGTP